LFNILIAEDCDTDYMLLEHQLKKLLLSVECERAANRRELTDLLRRRWDFIVSDYHLSDIEGEDLLSLVAQNHFDAPCLILSGLIESVPSIDALPNVRACIQKGDRAAFRNAVLAVANGDAHH
jgi:CheY-like chemotaxis protein